MSAQAHAVRKPVGAPVPAFDVDELRDALLALSDALEREAQALVLGDVAALEQLAGEKQARLDVLEWALPSDLANVPDDVLATMRACRERNRDNAEAVATRLRTTRDTLGQIGRLVGSERSVVYGADGSLGNTRRGRHLGSV